MRKPIDACFRTIHPFNFTIRSIKHLLENTGFKILSHDMSSYTMLRIAARVEETDSGFVPMSNHDLLRIGRFMESWKIYSRVARIKSFSKLAHLYAEWVWYRNKDINDL